MDCMNEINSYNSLSMSPSMKKELRSSTSYRTTKINIGNEINDALKKNEMNSYKRVSLELHNSHQDKTSNFDKNFSNIQDISTTKEDDSSQGTISKLPKIHKYLTPSSLNTTKELNPFSKNDNSSNNNYFNINKDSSITNNNNNSITNSNRTSYNFYKSQNNKYYYYNRSHNMSSADSLHNNGFFIDKNYNPFIPPADPLLKRTLVPKVNPRFGKMKAHITLPEFKGEEPIIKFEYKPMSKEMLTSPSIEKQYEVSLYVNSTKMKNTTK